ncbi:MAG: hypothetical protein P1V51_23475 [Deltaproteobacteria bacterium]|nr:hypothetical protein [Deltaproteobacteria bacterium]
MCRPQFSLLLACALLSGAAGCSRALPHGAELLDSGAPEDGGERDDGGLDAGFDAGVPDAGRDGGAPDGGGPETCTGPSSLRLGQTRVRPLPVTSSPLAMGCCDGAWLILHTTDALGRVLTLMVRGWGGFTEGTFDLETAQQTYEVTVLLDNGQINAPVSGVLSVRREQPREWDSPAHVSLCGKFELWGEPASLWIDEAVVAPWSWERRFALHLLRDLDLGAVEVQGLPLEQLELQENPIISIGTMEWYDWSDHAIFPHGWDDPSEFARRLPVVGVGGLPFVGIADGERIYLGAFWTDLSSLVFRGPVIRMENLGGDAFYLEPGMDPALDPRGDPRIEAALSESGKLAP